MLVKGSSYVFVGDQCMKRKTVLSKVDMNWLIMPEHKVVSISKCKQCKIAKCRQNYFVKFGIKTVWNQTDGK